MVGSAMDTAVIFAVFGDVYIWGVTRVNEERRAHIQNHGQGDGANQDEVLRPGPLRMGGGILFSHGRGGHGGGVDLLCGVLLRWGWGLDGVRTLLNLCRHGTSLGGGAAGSARPRAEWRRDIRTSGGEEDTEREDMPRPARSLGLK